MPYVYSLSSLRGLMNDREQLEEWSSQGEENQTVWRQGKEN